MTKRGFGLAAVMLLSTASGLVAQSNIPPAVKAAEASIDGEKIRAHVKFLSDDLLEGRGPGLRGARLLRSILRRSLRCMG